VRYFPGLFLAVFLSACGDDDSATQQLTAAQETVRDVPAGELIGSVGPRGAHQWLAVPFAEPPVGELRWRAPQAMSRLTGTLQALEHGSACVQPDALSMGKGIDGIYGDEDCLTLSIYSPPKSASEAKDAKLPVMVWIHGGGNVVGEASTYDGGDLAMTQDVVVVTVQYRLGPLGWFHHQELNGANASLEDHSGNYGTLDTIAALKWVQENIAGFGGDAGNVTIFGESAGGENVFALLVSPLADGLFHRAISQSGVAVTTSVDFATETEKKSSHVMAQEMMKAHGLASVPELRSIDAGDVIRAYMTSPDDLMLDTPTNIADGHVLPETPLLEVLEAGEFNKVPTILGTTRDEFKLFMAQNPTYVDRYLGFWMYRKNPERYERDAYYGSTQWRIGGAAAPARVMDSPVYVYRFDWDNIGKPLWMDLPGIFGAAHAFELPFLFPSLDLGPLTSVMAGGDDEQGRQFLSQAMMNYWGNFAHHGDPNKGKPVPASWQRWDSDQQLLVLDDDSSGGIRSGSETATIESLIAQLAEDERFESDQGRCELFEELSNFRNWSFLIREHGDSLGCGG